MVEQSAAGGTGITATVDLGISDSLNRAAQAVVFNKYLIDRAAADHGASMLVRDLHDYTPHHPLTFLCHILPFYRTCDRIDDGSPVFTCMEVPTANTLGCSWRWRGRDLRPKDREDCLALSDFQRMAEGKLDEAVYAWVKPLGIFAPSEGKNRVDFFREESKATIPAKVYERTYPNPSRLAFYVVKKGGYESTWVVLDGRWVEEVPNPSWTLPLLQAYGVKKFDSWPAHLPDPELVQLARFESVGVTSPLGHPDFGVIPVVDLETITAIQAHRSETVAATLFDLGDVRIDHRIWIGAAIITLLGFVLLAAMPDAWNDAKILAGLITGGAMGAGLAPFLLPILKARRSALSQHAFLPPSKAPKAAAGKTRRRLG